MSDSAAPRRRSITRLTDPVALRALAHPVRLSLVGLLREEGPLTATRAAGLLGESSGTCSFHLRQLAKYGLVEEAGGGRGREKPWRATAMFTAWPEVAATPALAAATGLLSSVIAERYFGELMTWLEVKAGEPAEWQSAALFGDTMLYVTADELAELGRQERQLVDRFLGRQARPELIPPGARLVSYLHLAYPRDALAAGAGSGGLDPEGGPDPGGGRAPEGQPDPGGSLDPEGGPDPGGGRAPEGRPDPGGAQ